MIPSILLATLSLSALMDKEPDEPLEVSLRKSILLGRPEYFIQKALDQGRDLWFVRSDVVRDRIGGACRESSSFDELVSRMTLLNDFWRELRKWKAGDGHPIVGSSDPLATCVIRPARSDFFDNVNRSLSARYPSPYRTPEVPVFGGRIPFFCSDLLDFDTSDDSHRSWRQAITLSRAKFSPGEAVAVYVGSLGHLTEWSWDEERILCYNHDTSSFEVLNRADLKFLTEIS